MGIVLITGKNNYAAERELHKRRGAAGEYTSFEASECSANEVVESFSANSLFATSQSSTILVMRPSENKDLSEWIANHHEDVPSETSLILYDPSIDKRSVFYKELKKSAEVIDVKQLKDFEIVQWATELAKKQKIDIRRSELSMLVSRTGNDQFMVASELEKLGLLERAITRDDIETMVMPKLEDNVFTLLDKIAAKDSDGALKYLTELDRANAEPIYILSMIVWQMQNMVTVKTASDLSISEIAKQAKMSPYVVEKTKKLVRSTSLTELRDMLDLIIAADHKMKTRSVDTKQVLRLLIIRLSGKSA